MDRLTLRERFNIAVAEIVGRTISVTACRIRGHDWRDQKLWATSSADICQRCQSVRSWTSD